MEFNNIVVGLDIGTSKVCMLVARPGAEDGQLEILGIGITESEGLHRGVVVNIEKTVKTIKSVIEQAEQQSGMKITKVTVGIAGDHIESSSSREIIGISSSNQEITEKDINRLLENARKISIPADRKIIHVMPQEFIVDAQDGISDPIGMSGVRLEADVHIITGLNTAIRNINTCVERCGLEVEKVVLEPIASSRALLSDDEKEVGVAIIDIGGGTTDLAVFEENIIRFTSVIGIGGKHVTDDIRKGLGIIAQQAERIKREFGHSYETSIMKDDVFMIPGIGGRKPMEVSKSELCRIIQPRMEELFEFAHAELSRSGYIDKLGAGIIITGGTCLLKGTEDLAREIFGIPVKLGIPSGITYSGLAPMVESPVYSTGVGLTLFAMDSIPYDQRVAAPLIANQESEHINNKETTKADDGAKQEDNNRKSNDKKESILGKVNNFLKNL